MTSPASPCSVRTRMFSSTATKPREVVTPAASRPISAVLGTRPVAIMAASTSRVSTCSLVSASIISIVTGLSPGIPGVTLLAKTPVRKSIGRGRISILSACLAISRSNVGMIIGRASMNVTSDPKAVYTSLNSRPMYPDPMMATYSGTNSKLRAPSEVYTVFSSTSHPGGTNGTDPGASTISFAVYTFPVVPSITSCGFPVSTPRPSITSTPSPTNEFSRFPFTLFARFFACAAMPLRSNSTLPSTLIPRSDRWDASRISRTRPEAARRALDGTQPRFTQVPPTSAPAKTAVERSWAREWRAQPCPPTPQPTMITSYS
mmetsp:Transcript_34279/g.79204  ORF Transcript_34279/g.79204 Transcript_34279/m.79204 type:complete len:318 (+) Transcript_34279:624-1577(+)